MTQQHSAGLISMPHSSSRDFEFTRFTDILINRSLIFHHQYPSQIVDICVHDRKIRMRIPATFWLQGISPEHAFFNCECANREDYEPDFELLVVDERSDPILPHGHWNSTLHAPLGAISSSVSGQVRIAIDRHTQSVSVFSPSRKIAVYWRRDLADLPYWAAATPFRLPLSWICDAFDAEFVHGACIDRNDAAILVAGKSGSGKSTNSLLLTRHNRSLIADDYLVVRGTMAQAVYRRVKLHDSGLAIVEKELGELKVLNRGAVNQKRIIELDDRANSRRVLKSTIKFVVIPEFAPSSFLGETSRGHALAQLSVYSLSGLLGGSTLSLARIANLTAATRSKSWGISENNDSNSEVLEPLFSGGSGE